jgi:2,3-bisphosphoglycerate-independent phosphoglycerate mutase
VKYAIVIADGAADKPLDALGGKTALEAADIPNMDRVAREGETGTARTIPNGYQPGSDVAIMTVLGYEAAKYYTGRAPLEAASMGVALDEGDYAARANLVTIGGGLMIDYSAGHISNDEAKAIMASLNEELKGEGLEFYPGKSYRNLLVMRGVGQLSVETAPPHDILDQPVEKHLPQGTDAKRFRWIMEKARPVLREHPVNRGRSEAGKPQATDIWLWGGGGGAKFPAFRELFGVRPAVITYVDLVAGITALTGWERIAVPGATGYIDTDYRGKGARAIEGLAKYDLVFVHVEAPDEASHNGDAAAKVAAIEEIDRHVVGPLLEALPRHGEWRLLVLPDHYTLTKGGAHYGEPVPYAMCGTGVKRSGAADFSEKSAGKGARIEDGTRLVRMFLGRK